MPFAKEKVQGFGPVTGHLDSGNRNSVNPRDAILMGIDRIEHFMGGDAFTPDQSAYASYEHMTFDTPAFEKIAALYKEHHVFFDATLSAYGYTAKRDPEVFSYFTDEKRFLTPYLRGIVEARAASFVDGGIIGPPPTAPGTTRLYVSGPKREDIAALFAETHLHAIALDGGIGAASALKMAYAAWTKGSTALIAAVCALAAAEGVEESLVTEWKVSQPSLPREAAAVPGKVRKAWRWVAEMEEIAASFAAAGLPDGFHLAAADIYARLANFKDSAAAPSSEEVTRSIRQQQAPTSPWRGEVEPRTTRAGRA